MKGEKEMTLEICCECEMETGNAGRDEDSLYFGEAGPYCSQCYDDVILDLPSKLNEIEQVLEKALLVIKRIGA